MTPIHANKILFILTRATNVTSSYHIILLLFLATDGASTPQINTTESLKGNKNSQVYSEFHVGCHEE